MNSEFNVTKRDIDEFNDFITNEEVMQNLTIGEQMLLMSAYGKLIEAIRPIMDKHKHDLVKYKITKITKK